MRHLLAISTAALVLVLAACGSGGGDKPATRTPAATPTAAPKARAGVSAVNDACLATTSKLGDLPDFPFKFDPNRPGRKLKRIATLLDKTDHDDYIEADLLRGLQALKVPASSQEAFARLVAALRAIIKHETLRNQTGLAGNVRTYVIENRAAEKAYARLRAAAKELKAPLCALGTA